MAVNARKHLSCHPFAWLTIPISLGSLEIQLEIHAKPVGNPKDCGEDARKPRKLKKLCFFSCVFPTQ